MPGGCTGAGRCRYVPVPDRACLGPTVLVPGSNMDDGTNDVVEMHGTSCTMDCPEPPPSGAASVSRNARFFQRMRSRNPAHSRSSKTLARKWHGSAHPPRPRHPAAVSAGAIAVMVLRRCACIPPERDRKKVIRLPGRRNPPGCSVLPGVGRYRCVHGLGRNGDDGRDNRVGAGVVPAPVLLWQDPISLQ